MPSVRNPDLVAESILPPPSAFCPTCARPLVFRGAATRSGDAIGNRYDHYECPTCGRFELRFGTPEVNREQPG
jgi:predicted RNA-binding Zn-ribbon protein involved in translation (DUF1610 family)